MFDWFAPRNSATLAGAVRASLNISLATLTFPGKGGFVKAPVPSFGYLPAFTDLCFAS